MARNAVLTMGQWQARVNEVFTMARECRWPHNKILLCISDRIFTELYSKTAGQRMRYTSYIHGYVQGLIDAERRTIAMNEVEFCYLVEGVLYSTSKKETGKPKTEEFYSKGQGHILNDAPSGHYWIGTDKPY